MLTSAHVTFFLLTIVLVTCAGIYSLLKVRSENNFSMSGKSISPVIFTGTIVGTLVGGSSTIGTSQLAFKYGFSAWWFTLGAGIACLLLGLFLAVPIRESGATKCQRFLALTYGDEALVYAAIFSALGIYFNIIAQVLAAVAVFTSILNIDPFVSAAAALVLIITSVIFGRVWNADYVGSIKVILIYFSMFTAGLLALSLAGGIQGIKALYPSYPWLSLYGRGIGTDAAAGFSVIIGVLSTQTYLQAVFSGKNVNVSRSGALISAVIIPTIGLAGVIIGLYMRSNFPAINANEALPLFLINYLPPWLGGIATAALLISIIGTGAALFWGIGNMISQDIYKRAINPGASDSAVLLFSRLSIIILAAPTLIIVYGNINSLILNWSILSMGLRGATICFPLLFAIFFQDKVNPTAGKLAIVLAPLGILIWAVWGFVSIDPLYPGLIISLSILLCGLFVKNTPKRPYSL